MVREMKDPVRSIYIDNRMSLYEGYVPDGWSAKTFGPVNEKSALDEMLVDLVMTWRTIGYTASMPAVMIKGIQSSTLAYASRTTPASGIVDFGEKILAKVSRKVPELVDDRRLRHDLMAELATTADDFCNTRAAGKPKMPIEPIWANFLSQDAFLMALWSSQRVAFVAFYNAYEAFLVDCLKLATGEQQLRASDKTAFNQALRTALPKDISIPCWMHREVNIARLVRHALSHAGGRETDELTKLKPKHGVKVLEGVLQIFPDDNHNMLRRLRQSVEALVAVVLTDPNFTAPLSKE